MRVLGIETSCDETGVAIYDSERGLLAEALHSQAKLHADYGGVVPELASRDHVRRLIPLLRRCLNEAQSSLPELDGIAYTAGPGLIGALLTGACFAPSLASALNIPVLGIHHMEAHLLVTLLESPAPEFPFIALLVSGGHTMLIEVESIGRYRVLGQTRDDAAGEAFDKTAQLLELGYPGGPAIAAAAERGDPQRFAFPRPMAAHPGLDLSFSGLKTSVMQALRRHHPGEQATIAGTDLQADIAASFQQAVVDTLVGKCLRALEFGACRSLVVAGGVGANQLLRSRLREAIDNIGGRVFWPAPARCTDNGVMVAYTGCLRLAAGQRDGMTLSGARSRWSLEELSPPQAAA